MQHAGLVRGMRIVAATAVHCGCRQAKVLIREVRASAVVAGRTALRYRFEQEGPLTRRMGPMASQTARHVLRGWVRGFILKLNLNLLMATGAKRTSLRHEEGLYGASMRLMARSAFSVHHWIMIRPALRQECIRIMALAADASLRASQQGREVRSVRNMTGVTASCQEGFMLFHALRLRNQIAVTLFTEGCRLGDQ